jgi:hypothetical protein
MAKAYFDHLAGTVCITHRKIPQPVMHIHAVTTAGITSAITLTSIRFTRATATTAHDTSQFIICDFQFG